MRLDAADTVGPSRAAGVTGRRCARLFAGLIHHATLGFLMFRLPPANDAEGGGRGRAAWRPVMDAQRGVPRPRHLFICLRIMQLETYNFMLPL